MCFKIISVSCLLKTVSLKRQVLLSWSKFQDNGQFRFRTKVSSDWLTGKLTIYYSGSYTGYIFKKMAYNVIFKILGLSEELTSKNKRRKQDFRSSNSFKYGRSNLSLTQTPILYCAIYYIEVHIYIILSHYFCTESVAPSWHQDAFTLSFSAPVSCLSCAQLCSVAHPCTGAARETQRGRRRARTFVWKCSRVNSNTAENRGAKGGKGVRRTASGKPLEAAAVFFFREGGTTCSGVWSDLLTPPSLRTSSGDESKVLFGVDRPK